MNAITFILTAVFSLMTLAWCIAFFKFMYQLIKGYKIPAFFYLW